MQIQSNFSKVLFYLIPLLLLLLITSVCVTGTIPTQYMKCLPSCALGKKIPDLEPQLSHLVHNKISAHSLPTNSGKKEIKCRKR